MAGPEKRERRRQQRIAREREAAQAESRRRRMRRLTTGLIAAAAATAVIVSVVALTNTAGGTDPSWDERVPAVPIPAPRLTNLEAAVRAAGCRLRAFREFGRKHVLGDVDYRTSPPTSGNHNQLPAEDGAYGPGKPPKLTQAVHALEHGRVEIQWRPGLPRRQIGQLKTLFDERDRHALLFANHTGMPYAVAATAWRRLLGCPTFNNRVFDAIRAFRTRYTDKGPEQVQ
jgi:hypothetical protein